MDAEFDSGLAPRCCARIQRAIPHPRGSCWKFGGPWLVRLIDDDRLRQNARMWGARMNEGVVDAFRHNAWTTRAVPALRGSDKETATHDNTGSARKHHRDDLADRDVRSWTVGATDGRGVTLGPPYRNSA